MKELLCRFVESHERDILWLLFALIGWGLAFWYMPADLRGAIFTDATLLVESTAVVFFIGLFFRWMRVLGWMLLALALSLLFGEHIRHSLIEGNAMERIVTFSMVLGLLLAHSCPSWGEIRDFLRSLRNVEVSR
jgi:hypothetical protein